MWPTAAVASGSRLVEGLVCVRLLASTGLKKEEQDGEEEEVCRGGLNTEHGRGRA